MKKLLVTLICLFCCTFAYSETQWFNSDSYAYKTIDYYGNWNKWSSWNNCDVDIKFDTNADMIIIYSNKVQIYKITNYNGTKQEKDGSQQAYFSAIDYDGDKCTIRLRIETNGNSQIYVEFSNVMWVYNVVRIS